MKHFDCAGKEVLITRLKGYEGFPVESQLATVYENENIGIYVKNNADRQGGQNGQDISAGKNSCPNFTLPVLLARPQIRQSQLCFCFSNLHPLV